MLAQPVSELKGIGPRKAQVLREELGIITIEDLLYQRPRRYLDRSTIKGIKDCFVNEEVTVIGTVRDKRIRPGKKKILEVVIDDGQDSLSGIFFAGIAYFDRIFIPGEAVCFSGRITFFKTKQMVHPDFDFLDAGSAVQAINTGRIVPLYRSTEKLGSLGLDSRGFRRIIRQVIDQYAVAVTDPLEPDLLLRHQLMPLRDALVSLHFPDTMDAIERSRKRLAFNEIFFLHYYLTASKNEQQQTCLKKQRQLDLSLFREILPLLPFSLTPDQESALDDIRRDIESPRLMNRLLQGDVGSGKTVVSLLASCMILGAHQQVAFMAPTEVLAAQHYRSFSLLLGDRARIQLLTGGMTKGDKTRITADIVEGRVDIVIGTHALIQEGVNFRELGLIIIDEQHRFGVEQRGRLKSKGFSSDLLVMTATPIPRTLTLTIFGDLDVSVIRHKPSRRLPVKTMAFPASRIDGVYRSLEKYISQGRQVYYVLPLIEESEKVDLKSAQAVYEKLKKEIFPQRRIALLHGRMPREEKDAVLAAFSRGEVDILVTTTVIEVGIDVHNAAVMVIEHAERFGLSQLHQLRGRVGRGEHQSFCVLLYPDDVSDEALRRITTIAENDDGFTIAEKDLELRGAGEMLGLRQHGRKTGFDFTDLAADLELIMEARQEAAAAAERSGLEGQNLFFAANEAAMRRALTIIS